MARLNAKTAYFLGVWGRTETGFPEAFNPAHFARGGLFGKPASGGAHGTAADHSPAQRRRAEQRLFGAAARERTLHLRHPAQQPRGDVFGYLFARRRV